jgi:hypothetical protein
MIEKLEHIQPNLKISENVAVIGSSYTLLNNQYGEEIDSFDDVIRFNRAPIKGFENHVGTKTTVRAANIHVFTGRPPDSRFNIKTQNPKFIKNEQNCNIVCVQKVSNANKFIHESSKPYFMDSMSFLNNKYNLGKDPTVGFRMIYILIANNYKPTLFGFGVNESDKPTHYWEKLNHKSTYHNLNKERDIIKKWVEKDKVTIKL